MNTGAHLEIGRLAIRFAPRVPGGEPSRPVREASLSVGPGEVVGLVGESGCGKSLTALACLGLLPPGAIASGSIRLGDQELIGLGERPWTGVRGRRIAMIFQNPMTALNPFFRIGQQLVTVIRAHFPCSRAEAMRRAVDALGRVQLAADVAQKYPHQMSGGQLQRAMIAMAVACEPQFIVADEPTTALDVTVQARIMKLLRGLASDGMGLLLISHDLDLVAQVSDRLHVMYAGRVVESGPARLLHRAPAHPYAAALLGTQPRLGQAAGPLPVIEGRVPAADEPVPGCVFASRCARVTPECRDVEPPRRVLRPGSIVACHHPLLAATTVGLDAEAAS